MSEYLNGAANSAEGDHLAIAVPNRALRTNLDAALYQASLGINVGPAHYPKSDGACSCRRGDQCTGKGKHPCDRDWRTKATIDADVIRAEWNKRPNANIINITGPKSGIVVIDVDPRNGGLESVVALQKKYGNLPPTVTVDTSEGGKHYYFRHPGKHVKSISIAPGIDVRGDGGAAIAPGSVHASGHIYAYAQGLDPQSISMATLPDWITTEAANEKGKFRGSPNDEAHDKELIEVESNVTGASPAAFYSDKGGLHLAVAARYQKSNGELVRRYLLVNSDHEELPLDPKQLVERGVVLDGLPTGVPTGRWHKTFREAYVSGKADRIKPGDLWSTLDAVVKRNVAFTHPFDATTVPLWLIGTYLFVCFDAWPRLALHGPRASGKSRVLRLMFALALNPQSQLDPTAAALFRGASTNAPTLLLDEGEFLNGRLKDPAHRAIMSLLNAGYKSGAVVQRNREDIKNGGFVLEAFNVYTPACIACIAGLSAVLASRSITIAMLPVAKNAIGTARIEQVDPNPDDPPFVKLRDLLYRFALDHARDIRAAYQQLNAAKQQGGSNEPLPHLHNRDWELWGPLLAIAMVIGIPLVVSDVYAASKFHMERRRQLETSFDSDALLLYALGIHFSRFGVAPVTEIGVDVIINLVRGLFPASDSQNWITSQWTGTALHRLNLVDDRRRPRKVDENGNSTQVTAYTVQLAKVQELASRLGVELPAPEPDPSKLKYGDVVR